MDPFYESNHILFASNQWEWTVQQHRPASTERKPEAIAAMNGIRIQSIYKARWEYLPATVVDLLGCLLEPQEQGLIAAPQGIQPLTDLLVDCIDLGAKRQEKPKMDTLGVNVCDLAVQCVSAHIIHQRRHLALKQIHSIETRLNLPDVVEVHIGDPDFGEFIHVAAIDLRAVDVRDDAAVVKDRAMMVEVL